MCGRYALNISGEDLAIEFAAGLKDAAFTPSNWNISPTTVIPFISSDDEKGQVRSIQTARWGLIPTWAKDASRQANAINARVESIAEKPTFKSAFKSRRCLVPVTGYYEWATELGKYKPKQPFYISHKEKHSLAIAGLYESWINPATNSPITTAAIITREAVGIVAPIHHRMPVILPKDLWSAWLSNKSLTPDETEHYLNMINLNQPDEALTFWPVSDEVNNARNAGAQLAQEIALPESGTLF
jgi:putative SOS response-associated peptidase YedK